MDTITYVCPCLLGVEGFVAQELRDLGLENVQAENGRVLFSGTPEAMIKANIGSRYSERVEILLARFEARSFEELFQGVRALPWEDWIGSEDAFPVRGRSLSSKLASIPDCQRIIKKAVVERLKRTYRVDWFKETGPVRQIQFLIMKDTVSVMLDTTGPALHKRGYRKSSAEAPIRETLAAAMVKAARVRSDGTFYDPFCGSGTLLIEAAMTACHIAPGMARRFSAENWGVVPASAWQREREAARAAVLRDATFQAFGSDIDGAAVALALDNARKAGVISKIRVERADIADFRQETEYGCVVTNPPYGERLLDIQTAQGLYRTMGKVFQPKHGWSFTIISPDEEFESCFGRRADKRRKLYNGMLKCQLYQYFR